MGERLTQKMEEKFPEKLQRRKWSKKEITTIIYDELFREGKLTQKIKKIIREEGSK